MTAAQTDQTGRRPATDPAAVEESAPQDQALRPAAERGLTTIPASVVGRIAEQVASEYTHVGGAAGGLLGVGARRDFDSRPWATCDLYGTVAVLTLDVGVAFPVNLSDTCRGLRRYVRERVGELTGLQVGRLDIEISWLNPGTATRGALR
ncbi:Asp23/Gls24 family envelope stress response protein [Dietzia cercidiphylli]|uniref:Asp23/Gls24 family envelope stress response protein n=1 Tax=Dietzia cercidiphylli TaxID=498199 RepID=UPI00223B1CC0|nr:Asp23/Gls24 family envelope stress response protein [Dietzia cercidiphylli]MCT1515406.1 Asp23/Gls24 family envelope stress response protein [Dietzia cercidiphylli]